MLTAFSWGYDGWGNSTRELLKAFSQIERARGFEPPVFVDVRVRRAGRAVGFQGDTFERLLGRERSRWIPGLGNKRVLTRRGAMRLVRPADAFELLGVIIAQARQTRRVLFFCSCRSPNGARRCHRMLVRRELLAAAKKMRVPLVVEEWPGGVPSSRAVADVRVIPSAFEALERGATNVPLGKGMPPIKLLSLSIGAQVTVTDGRRRALTSVAPAVFVGGTWKLPLFVIPMRQAWRPADLMEYVRRFRREDWLDPKSVKVPT